jgi:putative transposase
LYGAIKKGAEVGILEIWDYTGCGVVEVNGQADNVRIVARIRLKLSISGLLGRVKGQSWRKFFHQFRHLEKKVYWGDHFWAKGYCIIGIVGLDADIIRKYVGNEEKNDGQ